MTPPRRTAAGARAARAFTLMEAIVCITVLGAIAAVATGLIVEASDRYVQATVRAQLHTEISIAMDRMVRQLRGMPAADAGGELVPDITTVTPNSITFDGGDAFTLSGDQLNIVIDGAAPAPMLTGVTAFTVETFDEDGDPLSLTLAGTACHPIQRIRLTVAMERTGVTEVLSAKVFLRGLVLGGGA